MATLLQTRQDFATRCGRFDLVTDFESEDYTDNGADFFIQAGFRLLDTMLETPRDSATSFKKDIAAGVYQLEMEHLRQAEEVWAYNHEEASRSLLTYKTLSELQTLYTKEFSSVDQATPLYWGYMIRPSQEQNLYASFSAIESAVSGDTAGFTKDYQSLLGDSNYSHGGILLLPPADATYTISVYGRFFSYIDDDAKSNYWTAVYPELAVMAACLVLEMHYRNTQGIRDWMEAMQLFLKGIDRDTVFTEMVRAGHNQLQG